MCNVENVFINILNIQQRIYVNQVSAICFEISHKLHLTALFFENTTAEIKFMSHIFTIKSLLWIFQMDRECWDLF
jgi:hypothetical protein